MDATWLNDNGTVIVTWLAEYGTKFHLAIRRIFYQNSTIVHLSKWTKVKMLSLNIDMELNDAQDMMLGFESGVAQSDSRANYTAQIRLSPMWNYEVHFTKITSGGEVNESLSIILDAPKFTVFHGMLFGFVFSFWSLILLLYLKSTQQLMCFTLFFSGDSDRNNTNNENMCPWYMCPGIYRH